MKVFNANGSFPGSSLGTHFLRSIRLALSRPAPWLGGLPRPVSSGSPKIGRLRYAAWLFDGQRQLVRQLLFVATAALTVFAAGCDSESEVDAVDRSGARSASAVDAEQLQSELALARELIEQGSLDQAIKKLYALMIRFPDDSELKLLAAQTEASRKNYDSALDIAAGIDGRSPSGQSAFELRYKVLVDLGRHSAAADVLLTALQIREDKSQLRHEAWRLLNQVGRREEASQQALWLCRLGLATERQLHSLIHRSVSFPTPEMTERNPHGDKLFDDGLGKARWYFSVEQFGPALEQLAEQAETKFENAASEAFYGRLLAETQNAQAFTQWHSNVSDQAKQFSDYWSALGTFFIDNKEHESAVRALMEAISRDPTDYVSYQRISKELAALDRADDGEQFRQHGITIAQSVQLAQKVYQSPTKTENRKNLAQYILQLGRPFETLAWTTTLVPANSIGPRQHITRQRMDLLSDPKAETMAVESSLIGYNPQQFSLDSGLKKLVVTVDGSRSERQTAKRDVLATPRLVNRASELGLQFQWYKDVEIDLVSIPIHESLGGGIAVLDYDLDGSADLYLGQGSGDPPTDQCTRSNQLFRNTPSQFIDHTVLSNLEDYHYSSGLAAGDLNQDGFPDLFLGSLGHNRVLINNGDGTFKEITTHLGEFPDRFTASVAIADINGDSLPDLFESNYIEMEGGFALPEVGPDGKLKSPTPLSHFPDGDRWFENLGNGDFQIHEITREIAKPGTSLGLVITDLESDGKNEVFVGIDVRPNHLLVQTENNSFVNLADSLGLANGFQGAPNGCMGIATGDFNRDGRFDMQIANYSMEPANLFLQNESGDYTDYSARYGLAAVTDPYVGFGTKAVDFDRNGFLDFIVTNGHIFDIRDQGEPYQMEPQVMMSTGRGLNLTQVKDESGYWDKTYLGRTIAMLDYDHDGAMDFVIGHLDQPVALLHDETQADGSWLQFELIGTASERDAIGAKLVLDVGDQRFTQWVTAGDGYFCSDESVIAFGFENPATNDNLSLQVHWPSGLVQSTSSVQAGNRYLLIEGQSEVLQR